MCTSQAITKKGHRLVTQAVAASEYDGRMAAAVAAQATSKKQARPGGLATQKVRVLRMRTRQRTQ